MHEQGNIRKEIKTTRKLNGNARNKTHENRNEELFSQAYNQTGYFQEKNH